MPRPSLTDEQRREIRRSIRHAAATLHAKNGMKDISVRAIAEAAGVSVGTIYSHFGNLSDLMQSLWKQPARKLIQDLIDIAAAEPDPIVRLKEMFTSYVRFAHDNWSVYRGAFMYVRPEGHQPPPRIELDKDKMFSLLERAIQEGQEQHLIRSGEPEEIAQTLWSGIHGALALPMNFHRLALDESEHRVEPMFDLLFEWLQKQ